MCQIPLELASQTRNVIRAYTRHVFVAGILVVGCSSPQYRHGGDGDSRIGDVIKPCLVDEVTVPVPIQATAVGSTAVAAMENCLIILSQELLAEAHKKCHLHTKIEDQAEFCHAYRGNFNPDKGTRVLSAVMLANGNIEVTCAITRAVDYNCN